MTRNRRGSGQKSMGAALSERLREVMIPEGRPFVMLFKSADGESELLTNAPDVASVHRVLVEAIAMIEAKVMGHHDRDRQEATAQGPHEETLKVHSWFECRCGAMMVLHIDHRTSPDAELLNEEPECPLCGELMFWVWMP